MNRFRRLALHLLRVLRDGWLIVGITIAFMLAFELLYRAESATRLALARTWNPQIAEPPNPFDTTTWAADYKHDDSLETRLRWKPYVYLRNPTFAGRAISVDAEGHRHTPWSAHEGERPIELFFFGGSTAFGWYQRDGFTIPSEIARRLAERNVRVTNFGVPGFVFTQELIELQTQLRAGRRPDVVVFDDGVNDVFATLQDGIAGVPENEANRAADFAAGRARAADSVPGVRADLRVAGRALLSLADRLLLLKRLRRLNAPVIAPRISVDSATRSIVRVYAENARIAESLASTYGFTAIYVWQPSLLSSRKKRTTREAWLADSFADTTFSREYRDIMRAVPAGLKAQISSVAPGRFLDLSDLFHDEAGDVYIDVYGHTYESANPRIVESMLPELTRAVQGAAARPR